ncbi:putative tRNA methyltransferase 9B [Holothuria leucospilota]|uniref:tRNA methyltransferase 9B n=1 Tax=Holothuria leucospilota TaxID=206669 RepID=A0A9Q1BKH0_HOLLE|nr:putative tRNA methyltransferase 9B [Holothuria leucospilota]
MCGPWNRKIGSLMLKMFLSPGIYLRNIPSTKVPKDRHNGERLSQRSSSFTMGYKDHQPKNKSPVHLSTSGISSSDTSPVDSPQHTSRSPLGHSSTQSKVLTKCLSDASLQPHSKITSTMQKSPVCVASSQSLSSLPQNAHEYSCRNCKDLGKCCGEHLQNPEQLSDPLENETDERNSSFDESYINISFDKNRQEVRQGLYKGFCDSEDFLSEDGEVQSLMLEEEKMEKWDIGSSLQNLGRFEVNPLLTVMRSLAHLEKSLSLPETGCAPDDLQQLRVKNQSENNIPNGHYKDLRVLQLTSKQATIGVNSVNAKGEAFSKRTRGHGRSSSFTHQTSRDSSMESLSSSDDSVTTFPIDAKVDEPRKCHHERRHRRIEGLNGTTRANHGAPHFRSNSSLHSLSRSKSESDQKSADFSKYLRYYHVFREGELVELIEQNVPSLHIVKDFFDHANWCVVAEKVECWTI